MNCQQWFKGDALVHLHANAAYDQDLLQGWIGEPHWLTQNFLHLHHDHTNAMMLRASKPIALHAIP